MRRRIYFLPDLLIGLRNAPTTIAILAFSEGQLLAKSRRQQAPSITAGLHPTTDIKFPMSAFPLFTSDVGGKAAVVSDVRSRPEMTQNGRQVR